MARILLVSENSTFTALLEDHLHSAAHQVELAAGAAPGVSRAVERQVDLVVLELTPSAVSSVVVLQELRRQPETSMVPALVITSPTSATERLTLLRAGADEVLTRPVDLEEVILWIDRLLGTDETRAPALSGDLAGHPVWELFQHLEQTGKTGRLQIHSRFGSGRLRLERGRVVDARWDLLTGEEALLAIFDQEMGRFRFFTETPSSAAPRHPPLDGRRLLMEASWLRDELGRHRDVLPATGTPLRRVEKVPLPRVEEFSDIPLAEVAGRVQAAGSLRIFDLLAAQFAAPQKVRLAVAVLVKHGILEAEEGPEEMFPTTQGIHSSLLLEVAVSRLLLRAREAGLDASPLPCLLLAEPEVWGDVRKLAEGLPGSERLKAIRNLIQRLRERRGASSLLSCEDGELSLHLQVLTESIVRQTGGILPVCAGVVIWLAEKADSEALQRIVERLSHEERRANVVFVAPSDGARQRFSQMAGEERFTLRTEAPKNLIGLLRLFQPDGANPASARAHRTAVSPPRTGGARSTLRPSL